LNPRSLTLSVAKLLAALARTLLTKFNTPEVGLELELEPPITINPPPPPWTTKATELEDELLELTVDELKDTVVDELENCDEELEVVVFNVPLVVDEDTELVDELVTVATDDGLDETIDELDTGTTTTATDDELEAGVDDIIDDEEFVATGVEDTATTELLESVAKEVTELDEVAIELTEETELELITGVAEDILTEDELIELGDITDDTELELTDEVLTRLAENGGHVPSVFIGTLSMLNK
jgi:hypothetical protein